MSVNWVEVCFSLDCERYVTVLLQSWNWDSSSAHLQVNLQILCNSIVFVMQSQAEDTRMQEIMKLAHEFLQNFCAGNQQNQALLHKHINLFLNPGVRITSWLLFFSEREKWMDCNCLWACSDARLVGGGGVTLFLSCFLSKASKACLGPFQYREFRRLKWAKMKWAEIQGMMSKDWLLGSGLSCHTPTLQGAGFILTPLQIWWCLFSNFFLLSLSLDSGSSNNAAHFHEQLPALQWD